MGYIRRHKGKACKKFQFHFKLQRFQQKISEDSNKEVNDIMVKLKRKLKVKTRKQIHT